MASNGYIVLSVRHMGQKAEYDRVNAATSQAAAQQVSALNDRLRQDLSRDERAHACRRARVVTRGAAAELSKADARCGVGGLEPAGPTPVPGLPTVRS